MPAIAKMKEYSEKELERAIRCGEVVVWVAHWIWIGEQYRPLEWRIESDRGAFRRNILAGKHWIRLHRRDGNGEIVPTRGYWRRCTLVEEAELSWYLRTAREMKLTGERFEQEQGDTRRESKREGRSLIIRTRGRMGESSHLGPGDIR